MGDCDFRGVVRPVNQKGRDSRKLGTEDAQYGVTGVVFLVEKDGKGLGLTIQGKITGITVNPVQAP